MEHWLKILGFLIGLVLARAEWTVETNSLLVKEPSSLQGEHDAAIGDVCLLVISTSLHLSMLYIQCVA